MNPGSSPYTAVPSKARACRGLLSINHLQNRRCLTWWSHTASGVAANLITSIQDMLATRTNSSTARNLQERTLRSNVRRTLISPRTGRRKNTFGSIILGRPAGSKPVNKVHRE